MNDEKFIPKWKPLHAKKMARYIMPKLLVIWLLVISGNVIFPIFQPVEREKINYIIALNGVIFYLSTVAGILRWYSGEKRYIRIINGD